jgi:hypothetical protein
MLALAALLAAQLGGQHPAFLTGRWFGQGEPYDKNEMWLAELGPGGDIAVQFRTCHKGKAADLFEKGIWWFEGDIETVRITQSNGQAGVRETPYRILSHDGTHQTYSMPDGFVFRSARVDAGFKMPSCELVS